jgi:hypothetical protein
MTDNSEIEEANSSEEEEEKEGGLNLRDEIIHNRLLSDRIRHFWNTVINYETESLRLDNAPFTVFSLTPLSKIHFLFTMLSLQQMFIVNKGYLVGVITRSEFLRKIKK